MRNSRGFPATVDIPWILYTKNVTAICQNFQTVLGDKIQVARGEKRVSPRMTVSKSRLSLSASAKARSLTAKSSTCRKVSIPSTKKPSPVTQMHAFKAGEKVSYTPYGVCSV